MANFQDYRTFYQVCPKALSLDRYFFLIFVNDIDTVVYSYIKKFADDCKVYRPVSTAEDINASTRYKQSMSMAQRLANAF